MSELLSKGWMVENDGCVAGIKFAERNRLFGFPLDSLHLIVGDYKGYVEWVKRVLKADKPRANVVCTFYDGPYLVKREETAAGFITWDSYDHAGNRVHHLSSNGYESWSGYDDSKNLIYHKSGRNGDCIDMEYDALGNMIHHINDDIGSNFESFLEYGENGLDVHYRDTTGREYWQVFDCVGNRIKDSGENGSIFACDDPTEFYANGQLKSIGNMYIPLIQILTGPPL